MKVTYHIFAYQIAHIWKSINYSLQRDMKNPWFIGLFSVVRRFKRMLSLKNNTHPPLWQSPVTAWYLMLKNNTVKPVNSGHLRVLKNLSSVIKRCPLLGGSQGKIVTFWTKHFVRYQEVSLFNYLVRPAKTTLLLSRSSPQELFCRKSVLKATQKWQENTCVGDSITDVFPLILQNYRTSQVTTSHSS